MKHVYLWLLLLLGTLPARRGQAQSLDSAAQKLASLFANVDKSQVPTGRLLEAAVPLGTTAAREA